MVITWKKEMIDKLKQHVEVLSALGERVVGGVGHKEASKYLISQVQELGLKPYRSNKYGLPYSVNGRDFLNIGACIPGSGLASDGAILLGAHYDTYGEQPGADDNAAAIAIYLEVVKILKKTPLRHDLKILFFDAEEPPHFRTDAMGSVYYYQHQRLGDIALALIPDLIGHSVPINGMENMLLIQGMESHPVLQEIIGNSENNSLPIIACANDHMPNMSDHYVFDKKNPFLFFTCGLWKHYHQKSDTPEKLNYQKMESTANFFIDLVKTADKHNFCEGYKQADVVDTELYFLNKNVSDKVKNIANIETFKTHEEMKTFLENTLLPMLITF